MSGRGPARGDAGPGPEPPEPPEPVEPPERTSASSVERRSLVHPSEFIIAGVLVLAVTVSAGLSLYVTWRWLVPPSGPAGSTWDSPVARALALVVLGVEVVAWTWARLVEPGLVRVTRLRNLTGMDTMDRMLAVRHPVNPVHPCLMRLAFMSDLHVERPWPVGRRLGERLRELAPDAILLGGDYLNGKTRRAVEALERRLREFGEIAPVYGVLGNGEHPDPSMRDTSMPGGPPSEGREPLPADLPGAVEQGLAWHRAARPVLEAAGVRVIENESVCLHPGVMLHGVSWLDLDEIERLSAALDRGRLNVCLTHSPGLIPEAARAGFDLYLCGHTHGGQVRLPFYGAVITLSVHGKRFEAGRYDVGRHDVKGQPSPSGEGNKDVQDVQDGPEPSCRSCVSLLNTASGREGPMTAYVTRGLGLESGFSPRVRFLCPPEIVLVECSGLPGAARA